MLLPSKEGEFSNKKEHDCALRVIGTKFYPTDVSVAENWPKLQLDRNELFPGDCPGETNCVGF